MSTHYVYILRCGDGSLYTGYTTDLERRLRQHRGGQGARYTRGRGPLKLIYAEVLPSRAEALKREWELKARRREKKPAR